MNDFTKDELELIYLYVKGNIRTWPLADKIQSMLDNYCEHRKDVYPLYTASGDMPSAGYCYDCDSVIPRNFINDNQ